MTDLGDAYKLAHDLNPADGCSRRSIYAFSDGLFTKLHATEDWGNILLDKKENVFSMILLSILPEEESKIVNNYIKSFKENLSKAETKINTFTGTNPNIAFNLGSPELYSSFVNGLSLQQGSIHKDHSCVVDRREILPSVAIPTMTAVSSSKEYFAGYTEDLLFNQYTTTSVNMTDDTQFSPKVEGKSVHEFQIFKDVDPICSSMPNIFEPNKPSQFSPSTKGSNISLKGFIQFYITQGQDQRIYLEKNTGHIPSYSLFIVIDGTESCFGKLSFNHSMQTIICNLYALKNVDFESVTIFVTNKKGVLELCHETSISETLNPSSDLYSALYSACANPTNKSDLAGAFASVYQIRAKQTTKAALCLCFTDAMVGKTDASDIGTMTSYLENRATRIVGIGIGYYPKLISQVFRYSTWAPNPIVSPIALAKVLRGNFMSTTQIQSQEVPSKSIDEIKNAVKIVDDPPMPPVFTDFCKELTRVTRLKETYGAIYNPISAASREFDGYVRDPNGTIVSAEGLTILPNGAIPFTSQEDVEYKKTTQLTVPGTPQIIMSTEPRVFKPLEILTGQKRNEALAAGSFDDNDVNLDLARGLNWKLSVLICQFWDYKMLPKNTTGESKAITKETLLGEKGPIKALEKIGAQCTIVQNYKDSIMKLRSGEFSQAWIICGRGEDKKPCLLYTSPSPRD